MAWPFLTFLALEDNLKLIEIHLIFMYLISLSLTYHLRWPRGYRHWIMIYVSWSWVQIQCKAIFERNFFCLNIVHYSRVYLITTAEFRVFFLKWVQFYVHTLLTTCIYTSFIAACMHHETLNENIFQKWIHFQQAS